MVFLVLSLSVSAQEGCLTVPDEVAHGCAPLAQDVCIVATIDGGIYIAIRGNPCLYRVPTETVIEATKRIMMQKSGYTI